MIEKQYGIIGKSLSYSLSPNLHNFWFKKNNLKANYSLIEIESEQIKDVIDKIRTKKLCGIKIIISTYKHTSFAVGSSDTIYNDPPQENKLYKCAYQNLPLYVDWIKKYLIVT